MNIWPKWYTPPRKQGPAETISKVARFYGITREELCGTKRCGRLVGARWVAAKVLQQNSKLSYPAIGRLLSRDHTTIIHACNNFEIRLRKYPEMQECLHHSAGV